MNGRLCGKQEKIARAMECAAEKRLSSIAFPLLSAGALRGQRDLRAVLQIGVKEICAGAYSGLTEVHLIGYTHEEKRVLLEVCSETLTRAGAAARGTEMEAVLGNEEP